jgi:predicted  nucleic acid-binding Zn-ribbon protein
VRRRLGQAERDLAAATERRESVSAELANAVDHREMGAIGERLAKAQAAVDAAEETWLALADEAEALGLEL